MLPRRWNEEPDDPDDGAGRMRSMDDPGGDASSCLSNGSITRRIRPSAHRRGRLLSSSSSSSTSSSIRSYPTEMTNADARVYRHIHGRTDVAPDDDPPPPPSPPRRPPRLSTRPVDPPHPPPFSPSTHTSPMTGSTSIDSEIGGGRTVVILSDGTAPPPPPPSPNGAKSDTMTRRRPGDEGDDGHPRR